MVPKLGAVKLRTEANDHLDRLLAPDTTIPWYRSILADFQEMLHPESLPPLELTSKPLAEKDMPGHELWGLYRTNKNSGVMSVLIHVGLFCLLWSITTSPTAIHLARQITILIAPPAPVHAIQPVEVKRSGGGGGNAGSRALRAPVPLVAELPKPIMRHYTPPPPMDKMDKPSLVTPQLYIPPEWVGTTDPNAHYGDPLSGLIGAAGNFGNGMGYGGGPGTGFGTGSGGGYGGGSGTGTGNGVGPGNGKGDTIYTAAKGMTPPEAIFHPEAEYTDEARKAQLNGKVVLSLVVETDGTPTNIEITRPLGLGLDRKAIEAVRQWKFKPATIAGKSVRARANVEVSFRLMLSALFPLDRNS
jgi:TonB family protein